MTTAAIQTNDLSKRYGDQTALDRITVSVDQGDLYGLLGPNGAGKTTLIDILLDFTRPTAGEARLFGSHLATDVIDVHSRVGVLPEHFGAYDDLTARQHLRLVADVNGATSAPCNALRRVGLADAADRSPSEFSQGMHRRLGLAMALVGSPDLLILDEPFSGLDPHGVRRVRKIVSEEHERGTTVLLSSHVLHEVAHLSDRVGILDDGALVAQGTPDSLRKAVDVSADASIETVFMELTRGRSRDDSTAEREAGQ